MANMSRCPATTSPLADKYRLRQARGIAGSLDPKPGYVWDPTRQDPGSDGWGRYPKSGRALVFVFPNCKDGRVVADIVKLQKGHTEGYEPNITDKIIELAVSAKGGKIATGSWTSAAASAAAERTLRLSGLRRGSRVSRQAALSPAVAQILAAILRPSDRRKLSQ